MKSEKEIWELRDRLLEYSSKINDLEDWLRGNNDSTGGNDDIRCVEDLEVVTILSMGLRDEVEALHEKIKLLNWILGLSYYGINGIDACRASVYKKL